MLRILSKIGIARNVSNITAISFDARNEKHNEIQTYYIGILSTAFVLQYDDRIFGRKTTVIVQWSGLPYASYANISVNSCWPDSTFNSNSNANIAGTSP